MSKSLEQFYEEAVAWVVMLSWLIESRRERGNHVRTRSDVQ